jgi:hypothetical protein
MPTVRTCLNCPATFSGKGRKVRCVDCQKKHARGRWKAPENQHKRRAQLAAQNAVAIGVLIRRPCESLNWRGQLCGRTPTHAHHEDYSAPLDVVWLCAACHRRRHWQLSLKTVPPLAFERPGLPAPDRDW